MKYSAEDLQYISGEKFSASYLLKLTENALYSRTETILNIVSGHRVVHVGCCDHLPLIEKAIQNNKWLQGILDQACEDVLGIDINEEAVNFVNNRKLAKHEVLCGDITSKTFCSSFDVSAYDYIVMGELLEHINNPVLWLGQINDNMRDRGFRGKYIITVPNALCASSARLLRRKVESINSDHKYWFTPYTIAKVCYEAGIVPEELIFSGFNRGGQGDNFITSHFFFYLEKIRKRPSSYEAYRGDQLVFIGKDMRQD